MLKKWKDVFPWKTTVKGYKQSENFPRVTGILKWINKNSLALFEKWLHLGPHGIPPRWMKNMHYTLQKKSTSTEK